jgi:hypothetical protein
VRSLPDGLVWMVTVTAFLLTACRQAGRQPLSSSWWPHMHGRWDCGKRRISVRTKRNTKHTTVK